MVHLTLHLVMTSCGQCSYTCIRKYLSKSVVHETDLMLYEGCKNHMVGKNWSKFKNIVFFELPGQNNDI